MKMRRLYIVTLFLIAAFGSRAQIYQQENLFGKETFRYLFKSAVGIPNDTIAPPLAYQSYPHLAAKDSILYVWSPSGARWRAISAAAAGGGGGSYTFMAPLSNNSGVVSLTSVPWSLLTGKPTTLSGYGITDAVGVSDTAAMLINYVRKGIAGSSGHTHIAADVTDLTTAVRNMFFGGTGVVYNNATGVIAIDSVKVRSWLGEGSTYTFTGPLSESGGTVSITQANGSTNGYLSAVDWTLFNSKVGQATLDDSTEALRAAIAATGITSLNGATNQSQTFTFTSAAGTMGWFTDNVTGIHTLRIPVADASGGGSTTGLVSGTTQTFAGRKTFNAGIVLPLINQTADTTDWKPLVRHSTGVLAQGWWYNTGAGGTSTLAGATDAAITSPTSGQVLSYNGEKWANTNAASYNLTSPSNGQLLKYQSGEWVNFTPTYAQQQALEDSMDAVRSAIGTGGGTSGYDSIAVSGETQKALFNFNPLDSSLNVTWGGVTFTYKPASTGTAAPTGFDAATVAYMEAESIPYDNTVYFSGTSQERTGAQLWDEVNSLIAGLKADNTWAKAKSIKLGVGSGLKNAKAPGTFDFTSASASTTPAVGQYGYSYDGVDDYLNDGIVPATHLGNGANETYVQYVRSTSQDKPTMAGFDGSIVTYLFPNSGGNSTVFRINYASDQSAAHTNFTGLFVMTRRTGASSEEYKLWRNGTQLFSQVNPFGTAVPLTMPVYRGCRNNQNAGRDLFNACVIGADAVFDGLTDSEAAAVNTRFTTFINNLSRN